MASVFLAEHSYENVDGIDETKLIGVFTSRDLAARAVESVSKQPGFVDIPDHFTIDEYQVDDVHWETGFVTEINQVSWSVWRRDDLGNSFLVSATLSEFEALKEVRELQTLGCGALYWARPNA